MELGSGSWAEELDRAPRTRRAREMPVAREKGRVERFGKRNVGGVVRGQVVSQFPDAGHQRAVRSSTHRQIGEIA